MGGVNGDARRSSADAAKPAPPAAGDVEDDVEDLVGEEAKLGIRKSAKPRGVSTRFR